MAKLVGARFDIDYGPHLSAYIYKDLDINLPVYDFFISLSHPFFKWRPWYI